MMCKPGSVGDLGGQPPRSTRPRSTRAGPPTERALTWFGSWSLMARLAVQALHVRIVGPAWPWRKGRRYGPHWVSFGPNLPRCSHQDEKSTGVNGRGVRILDRAGRALG